MEKMQESEQNSKVQRHSLDALGEPRRGSLVGNTTRSLPTAGEGRPAPAQCLCCPAHEKHGFLDLTQKQVS